MDKSRLFPFRVQESTIDNLKEVAIKQGKSVSVLIREAIDSKYQINDATPEYKYEKNKIRKVHGPRPKRWTEIEYVRLGQLYEPGKKDSMQNTAKLMNRSYSSIKHKICELKLGRAR